MLAGNDEVDFRCVEKNKIVEVVRISDFRILAEIDTSCETKGTSCKQKDTSCKTRGRLLLLGPTSATYLVRRRYRPLNADEMHFFLAEMSDQSCTLLF